MKILKAIFLFLLPASFLMAPQAHAGNLLANSCVSLSEMQSSNIHHIVLNEMEELSYLNAEVMMDADTTNMLGLSCKDIRAIDQTAYVVGVAITPAVSAMLVPTVRSALAVELASLGIVVGSPAIATATIIGTFGVVTYKVLMRVSLEKCAEQDRENLKRELFQELEVRYGLRPTPQTSLQITQ
jgi:hypothetical protein